MAMESPAAVNEDFNLSTPESTTVLELAAMIWTRIKGDQPLRVVHDPPFPHDVQMRVPDVTKAERVLGFTATTPLGVILDEVVGWVAAEIEAGRI
jgi:nucleoside-diphosphate-sugar epimerase